MNRLLVEGLTRQLAVLEALRDDALGESIDVCVRASCFLTREDHVKQDHSPTYWSIDQAIMKLRNVINAAPEATLIARDGERP